MRFLAKINRQYLLTYGGLLIITGVAGFFAISTILKNEIRENLLEKEYAVIREIEKGNPPPNLHPLVHSEKISGGQTRERSFRKIFIEDTEDDGEEEPFMEYTHVLLINGDLYRIKLRQSLYEQEELIMIIFLAFLTLLAMAFLVSFLINRRLNQTVWNDFEINLERIRKFSFKSPGDIGLKDTRILEFEQLNRAVTALTAKLRNDYRNLKEFTENASHELQTPISVIILNLEELLQENLPEKTWKQIANTLKAVKRLSVLNEKLLMLTKINNRQFSVEKEIDLNKIIYDKLEEFSPLITGRKLNVEFDAAEKLMIGLNAELAGILISNLLSNAIQHNIDGGSIIIKSGTNRLMLCNTGRENSLSNDSIFNRFTKENSSSYGLGLSIVKQICETHHIDINYFKNGRHCFELIKSGQL